MALLCWLECEVEEQMILDSIRQNPDATKYLENESFKVQLFMQAEF
jgi:hypothetical protein